MTVDRRNTNKITLCEFNSTNSSVATVSHYYFVFYIPRLIEIITIIGKSLIWKEKRNNTTEEEKVGFIWRTKTSSKLLSKF